MRNGMELSRLSDEQREFFSHFDDPERFLRFLDDVFLHNHLTRKQLFELIREVQQEICKTPDCCLSVQTIIDSLQDRQTSLQRVFQESSIMGPPASLPHELRSYVWRKIPLSAYREMPFSGTD